MLADRAVVRAPGKLAQALRGHGSYRQCKALYVDGSLQLQQVRINALIDGKSLCMPSPALKEGFYLLRPFQVPFKDLPFAVTLKGVASWGQRLKADGLADLFIDLAVSDGLAVDGQGGRLGDGSGFFDLALGLLASYQALAPGWQACALLAAQQLMEEVLPQDEWDVALDFGVTEQGSHDFSGRNQEPTVLWPALPERKIRKLDLLWQLWKQRKA